MNTREFRIGRVLTRSLRVVGQNLLPFLLLTVVAYLPAAISLAYMPPPPPLGPDAGILEELTSGAPVYQTWLENIAQALLGGAVAFATFFSLQGNRQGLLASLGHGARVVLPVIGVAILTGLGIGLGMLLVVPGVILACMWFVAVPVAAVERASVFESLGRSVDLTRGHRWRVFGVLCTPFLLMAALMVGLYLIYPFGEWVDTGDSDFLEFSQTDAEWRTESFVTLIIAAVFGLYTAVCSAVAYHDLRTVKEGVSTPDLLRVFE